MAGSGSRSGTVTLNRKDDNIYMMHMIRVSVLKIFYAPYESDMFYRTKIVDVGR